MRGLSETSGFRKVIETGLYGNVPDVAAEMWNSLQGADPEFLATYFGEGASNI
jgi:hypothetical protein